MNNKEDFSFEIAIRNGGICSKQKCECSECILGNLIYSAGLKSRIDDMCHYTLVYKISKLLKEETI